MQKIGAQYLVKKFADYVTAPPPEADAPPEPDEPRPSSPAPVTASLDGQPITGDEGEPLGTARHVPGVAVYIVSPGFGDRVDELGQALNDPDTRVLFHTVDGRLAGLIYVPDPAKAPPRTGGMRADEV